jgi:hypothetical protein
MAAVENDGKPNARRERCHESPVQGVTRNLTKSFKVNGADSIIESAFTIAVWIFHLSTCIHPPLSQYSFARQTVLTMAAVVEKEGVALVVIRNQPVECGHHSLPSRDIPRVILVVGKNNHA